jgi:segregation and condensation protein A
MLDVRFEETKTAEQATHVRLGEFDGPLGLLLSLIEARRLDVLTVPLGALAAAYVEALGAIPIGRLASVSAFVVIASQLILIKSRALLPRPPLVPVMDTDDTPDPEAELRERLLVYRAHRDAGRRLQEEAQARRSFRREPAVAIAAGRAGARPVRLPPLPPDLLVQALVPLVRLARPVPPVPEPLPRSISISQRVDVIRAALRGADSIVLQDLLEHVRDRVVRAVTFLALLELVKQREVTVEQAVPFGPILARRFVARTDG